jgi:hypothetical protein
MKWKIALLLALTIVNISASHAFYLLEEEMKEVDRILEPFDRYLQTKSPDIVIQLVYTKPGTRTDSRAPVSPRPQFHFGVCKSPDALLLQSNSLLHLDLESVAKAAEGVENTLRANMPQPKTGGLSWFFSIGSWDRSPTPSKRTLSEEQLSLLDQFFFQIEGILEAEVQSRNLRPLELGHAALSFKREGHETVLIQSDDPSLENLIPKSIFKGRTIGRALHELVWNKTTANE